MPTSHEREHVSSSRTDDIGADPRAEDSTVRQDSKKWLDYATHKAKIAFGQKKERFVEELGGVADMMREGAAHLEQTDLASAHYVEDGAERVERWKESLQRRDAEDFVAELATFARRHPNSFLLGSAAIGFSLMRLFRSVDYTTTAVLDSEEADAQSRNPSPAEDTSDAS